MSSFPRPLFQSFRSIGRNWFNRTRPSNLNDKATFEFTVASYNVLADQLLHDHPHLYFGRGCTESWIFDWNYRKRNLLAEIAYSNADILCLQEVQEEHYYDWFYPQLKEYGYVGVYNKRSGTKHDGCATFFKSELFNMKSHHLIHFYRPNSAFMDRDNVAILVVLIPRDNKIKNPTPICIGNTHLLFNKKRGDIKLAQLAHLFAEIDKVTVDKKQERMPTILCGDFNSTPHSPLYDFITTGELYFQGMSKAAISGQGHINNDFHSNNKLLRDSIFPRELGLTHTCKWRTTKELNDQRPHQVDLTKDSDKAVIDLTDSDEDAQCSTSSLKEEPGYLGHDLDFRSAYMHRDLNGTPEVTTCHDRACFSVDYIFYSTGRKKKLNDNEPPKLWLSGVLSLLTEYDLQKMNKLPNKDISSDHLFLMSSFIMS